MIQLGATFFVCILVNQKQQNCKIGNEIIFLKIVIFLKKSKKTKKTYIGPFFFQITKWLFPSQTKTLTSFDLTGNSLTGQFWWMPTCFISTNNPAEVVEVPSRQWRLRIVSARWNASGPMRGMIFLLFALLFNVTLLLTIISWISRKSERTYISQLLIRWQTSTMSSSPAVRLQSQFYNFTILPLRS